MRANPYSLSPSLSGTLAASTLYTMNPTQSPSPLRLRLVIDIAYTLNGEAPDCLFAELHNLATRAAGEGLFTGESPAEVDEWSATVEEVRAPVTLTPEAQSALDALRPLAVAEWREATANEETRLGFADWCGHQAEQADEDRESELDASTLRALAADGCTE